MNTHPKARFRPEQRLMNDTLTCGYRRRLQPPASPPVQRSDYSGHKDYTNLGTCIHQEVSLSRQVLNVNETTAGN